METADLKQCSRLSGKERHQCNHWFPASDKRKMCEMCRKASVRGGQTPKGRVNARKRIAKYRLTEKGKAAQARNDTPEKNRERYERRVASGTEKVNKKKYRQGAKGKAARKKRDARPEYQLARSLYKMVTGVHENPVRFPELGVFESNADAQAHLKSTFAPWMNWQNQSAHRAEMEPNAYWHIGHRIPKTWYHHDDTEEQKKCWSRLNLFAQCAVENTKAKDRNILAREQWLALKPIWPKQCAFMTNEEAWAWARDNVDNRIRRAERKARV